MTTVCANCGIAVRWQPTMLGGTAYCCAGCALGGPCECDYDHLPARAAVIRHVRFEISVAVAAEVEQAEPAGSNKALTTVQQVSNTARVV